MKRRRIVVGIIIASLLLALYCASFAYLLQRHSFTFIVKPHERAYLKSIQVYTFSRHGAANTALWYFYWPLHRSSAADQERIRQALLGGPEHDAAVMELRRVTLRDVQVLKSATE